MARRASRATVESDRIALHINDWYGGTHVGLWEWTSNYGEGQPVSSGQAIESTVRLQMVAPPEPRSAQDSGARRGSHRHP